MWKRMWYVKSVPITTLDRGGSSIPATKRDGANRLVNILATLQKDTLLLGLAVFISLLGNIGWCQTATQSETNIQGSELTGPLRVRVVFTTVADFGDLPVLMAHEFLSQQGYAIQTTFFAQAEFAAAALARGDADVGIGSIRTHWAAIGKGAEIVTIAEQQANPWMLYAIPEVRTCSDLDGKRFAISGEGSTSASMSSAYVSKNCPGIQRHILLIQGSANRAAALLAGEVDATPLELADFIRLQRLAPGRFHALASYAAEFPKLKTTGIHVNTKFAANHPEFIRKYLYTVLNVERRIYLHHELLERAASKYLEIEPELIHEITAAYFSHNIWNVNGGLTKDDVDYSLRFLKATGDLNPELNESTVADLSFLNSVFTKIGRVPRR